MVQTEGKWHTPNLGFPKPTPLKMAPLFTRTGQNLMRPVMDRRVTRTRGVMGAGGLRGEVGARKNTQLLPIPFPVSAPHWLNRPEPRRQQRRHCRGAALLPGAGWGLRTEDPAPPLLRLLSSLPVSVADSSGCSLVTLITLSGSSLIPLSHQHLNCHSLDPMPDYFVFTNSVSPSFNFISSPPTKKASMQSPRWGDLVFDSDLSLASLLTLTEP